MPLGTRVRLSAMMFLQYAIHAVWIVQMAAYLDGALSCTGRQISWVVNTAPLVAAPPWASIGTHVMHVDERRRPWIAGPGRVWRYSQRDGAVDVLSCEAAPGVWYEASGAP